MDLDAYFSRIGLTETPPSTASGLARLQKVHRRTIAFENLDIMLGRPILIDSSSVFDKLVRRGRGGYCFEQNRLYADALAALGIPVRPLLARVRLFQPVGYVPPLTHTLLLAELDEGTFIADAGFGGSFIPPIPLADGAIARTADGAAHRLTRTGAPRGSSQGEWLLERAGPKAGTDGRAAPHDNWQPQYSFDLSQVAPDDLEMGNHWTSTRAGTRFTSLHIASIALPTGFASLNEATLSLFDDGETSVRELSDPAEYREVLTGLFRMRISLDEVNALRLFA